MYSTRVSLALGSCPQLCPNEKSALILFKAAIIIYVSYIPNIKADANSFMNRSRFLVPLWFLRCCLSLLQEWCNLCPIIRHGLIIFVPLPLPQPPFFQLVFLLFTNLFVCFFLSLWASARSPADWSPLVSLSPWLLLSHDCHPESPYETSTVALVVPPCGLWPSILSLHSSWRVPLYWSWHPPLSRLGPSSRPPALSGWLTSSKSMMWHTILFVLI